MEGIGILHDEFARAHDTEARTDLVAELGLDLVEVEWQLLVGADLLARDVGDDFLVRRAETEIALMPVFDLQHLRTEHRPAAGLFPQLLRLHGRHQQFERACPVHFLAHHRLDLAQHAQAQRHPTVESGTQPLDEAGTQHQLVADEFGLVRGFFLGRNEKLGGTHGNSLQGLSQGADFTGKYARSQSGLAETGALNGPGYRPASSRFSRSRTE